MEVKNTYKTLFEKAKSGMKKPKADSADTAKALNAANAAKHKLKAKGASKAKGIGGKKVPITQEQVTKEVGKYFTDLLKSGIKDTKHRAVLTSIMIKQPEMFQGAVKTVGQSMKSKLNRIGLYLQRLDSHSDKPGVSKKIETINKHADSHKSALEEVGVLLKESNIVKDLDSHNVHVKSDKFKK